MWFLLIDQLCNMVSANLFAAIPPICHVADRQISRKRWKTKQNHIPSVWRAVSSCCWNQCKQQAHHGQACSLIMPRARIIYLPYGESRAILCWLKWSIGDLTVSVLMWWNPLRGPEVLLKMEHTFELSTYGKESCSLELWMLIGPKSWLDVPFSKEMVATNSG